MGRLLRLLGGPRHRVRRVRRVPARSARAQGTPTKNRRRVPQRRGKHRERRPLPRLRRLHGTGREQDVLSVARLPPELLLLLQPQPAGLRPLPHPRLSLGRRAGGLRPAGRDLGLRRLDGRGAPSQARRDRAVLREVPRAPSLGAHPPLHGRRPAERGPASKAGGRRAVRNPPERQAGRPSGGAREGPRQHPAGKTTRAGGHGGDPVHPRHLRRDVRSAALPGRGRGFGHQPARVLLPVP